VFSVTAPCAVTSQQWKGKGHRAELTLVAARLAVENGKCAENRDFFDCWVFLTYSENGHVDEETKDVVLKVILLP
jgi:hypothetical protein